MSGPAMPTTPAWLVDAAKPAPRHLLVKVKNVPPSNVEQRVEYEGLFVSSFDAYDDAMRRFPFAARVELQPMPVRTPKGDGHAA